MLLIFWMKSTNTKTTVGFGQKTTKSYRLKVINFYTKWNIHRYSDKSYVYIDVCGQLSETFFP